MLQVLAEPPNIQGVMSGNRVDGYDGPLVGFIKTFFQGINIGIRQITGAAVYITGKVSLSRCPLLTCGHVDSRTNGHSQVFFQHAG